MKVIRAKNINSAWDQAKALLNADHVVRPSRAGEVWEHPEPVTTVYENPCERVLFNPERNANPFFHLMEALWMLAGRNDVEWIKRFNSKIQEFVGEGPLLHDAYGHRWRYAFDLDGGVEDGYADQLPKIVRMLKKSPDERRAVLTMWNPLWDLERPELPSVPCNLVVTFKIRDGKLAMIVFCRSNDIVMGCYGANVVHFSMLQEYMAGMIGVPVGTYSQVSDSWHAYTARYESMGGLSMLPTPDFYADLGNSNGLKPFPLVHDPESFDDELKYWMDREYTVGGVVDDDVHMFRNRFFPEVAEPLWHAWDAYKSGNLDTAIELADTCQAEDWRVAATQWLRRVKEKRDAKKYAGVRS